MPELAAGELAFAALSGGITNRNFLVTVDQRPNRYVIRLAGNDTYLLGISRELAACTAKASIDFAVRFRRGDVARKRLQYAFFHLCACWNRPYSRDIITG